MKNQQEVQLFEVAEIQRRIMPVRGVQVMLDRDLAELYNVETKQLKRQVKRNIRQGRMGWLETQRGQQVPEFFLFIRQPLADIVHLKHK